MAVAGEEERLELEVAVILCDLKRIMSVRDRRRMRPQQRREVAQVIPSWGRRRLRSVLEDGNKLAAAAGVAERDGAASPDTPLAFPEDEEEDAARKATAQAEWVQEQRVVVASLSQENADLLKQIEEYRTRLLSSRSANESLKQLHKVRQQEEHARRMRAVALRHRTTTIPNPLAALGLDLNKPPEEEEEAAPARARAQERYWQAQKAAVTAEARRRRLEILRAKVVSCRSRRVVG